MKPLSIIRNLLLIIAAVVTVWAMLRAAGVLDLSFSTVIFIIFAISPYVLFGVAAYVLERFTKLRGVGVSGAVIALILLVITVLSYVVDPSDQSSTYALVFVIMPIYLIVGSFVLLGIGIGAAWFGSRRTT